MRSNSGWPLGARTLEATHTMISGHMRPVICTSISDCFLLIVFDLGSSVSCLRSFFISTAVSVDLHDTCIVILGIICSVIKIRGHWHCLLTASQVSPSALSAQAHQVLTLEAGENVIWKGLQDWFGAVLFRSSRKSDFLQGNTFYKAASNC